MTECTQHPVDVSESEPETVGRLRSERCDDTEVGELAPYVTVRCFAVPLARQPGLGEQPAYRISKRGTLFSTGHEPDRRVTPMRLRFDDDAEAFRAELDAWLDANA